MHVEKGHDNRSLEKVKGPVVGLETYIHIMLSAFINDNTDSQDFFSHKLGCVSLYECGIHNHVYIVYTAVLMYPPKNDLCLGEYVLPPGGRFSHYLFINEKLLYLR